MAEIEDQVRLLADRRFARTAAVPTEQIRPATPSPAAGLIGANATATNLNDEPPTESADHTGDSQPHEGDLIMVDIQTEEAGKTQPDEMNRRRLARRAILAAAAAAVVIVIAAVALFDGTEKSAEIDVAGPADIDAPEPEQLTPEPTIFGAESSLAVVDEYFATYNAGDFDSLLALFTDDASFSSNVPVPVGKLRITWSLAQGSALTSPECAVVDEVAGVAVTVSCEHGTLQSTELAVGAPAVSTTTKMTIGPDGITDLRETYGGNHFQVAGDPFRSWMEENHPEDAKAAGCCQGRTVEESVARGELRAQYSDEWATYLEANDCTYSVSC
jgi:hypothetical protein